MPERLMTLNWENLSPPVTTRSIGFVYLLRINIVNFTTYHTWNGKCVLTLARIITLKGMYTSTPLSVKSFFFFSPLIISRLSLLPQSSVKVILRVNERLYLHLS
uniref:Uncharacterized protein n=1 Tax=Cacopsylla melanoneura TaxID=428564 RepID=A0A8D9F3H5_9HEMI